MRERMESENTKKRSRWLPFVLLQVGLFIFSLGNICSKLAGREEFLSFRFFLFYGLVLVTLAVYAVIWQQVLKHLSLTVAYASKGVLILYGLLWGTLLFGEQIRWNMIFGALLVLAGSLFFLRDDAQRLKEDGDE